MAVIATVLPAAFAAALPVAGHELEARASCVRYCGSVCYWQDDIDAALAQGYKYYKAGTTVGKPRPSPP